MDDAATPGAPRRRAPGRELDTWTRNGYVVLRYDTRTSRGIFFRLNLEVIGGQLEQIGFGNFLQAAAELARFFFQEALTHFRGFFALLQIDPVTDFGAKSQRRMSCPHRFPE